MSTYQSPWMTEELAIFREAASRFVEAEMVPKDSQWRQQHHLDKEFWRLAGSQGFLCTDIPECYGGGGGDFRHEAVFFEEQWRRGLSGMGQGVHSITAHYILNHGTEEQKQRWLPAMARGELIGAIAMTEPGTGSDLQGVRTTAVRDGDDYVINGQKTFISNGQHCDIVIAVTRTNSERGSGSMSLIVVETDRDGFRRGRNLDKLGQLSADTSEIFFDDVRVPVDNLLGGEGRGMNILMSELPQERLTIGVTALAAAQRAYDITLAYAFERKAFGKPIGDFQVNRHKLADMKTELTIGWAFADQCIARHVDDQLSAAEASMAKLWLTEMQGRIVDQCLQLHGGYGFMREYDICRMYADARIHRIYGGTSEIMRELISRAL